LKQTIVSSVTLTKIESLYILTIIQSLFLLVVSSGLSICSQAVGNMPKVEPFNTLEIRRGSSTSGQGYYTSLICCY